MRQGHGRATPADPLVQRPCGGRQTSDRQPGQAHTRGGRGDLEHPDEEGAGRPRGAAPGLPPAATAARVHPEKQWHDAPPRHSDAPCILHLHTGGFKVRDGAAAVGVTDLSILSFLSSGIARHDGVRRVHCRRTGLRSAAISSADTCTHQGPCGTAWMPSRRPAVHHAAIVVPETLSSAAAARAV